MSSIISSSSSIIRSSSSIFSTPSTTSASSAASASVSSALNSGSSNASSTLTTTASTSTAIPSLKSYSASSGSTAKSLSSAAVGGIIGGLVGAFVLMCVIVAVKNAMKRREEAQVKASILPPPRGPAYMGGMRATRERRDTMSFNPLINPSGRHYSNASCPTTSYNTSRSVSPSFGSNGTLGAATTTGQNTPASSSIEHISPHALEEGAAGYFPSIPPQSASGSQASFSHHRRTPSGLRINTSFPSSPTNTVAPPRPVSHASRNSVSSSARSAMPAVRSGTPHGGRYVNLTLPQQLGPPVLRPIDGGIAADSWARGLSGAAEGQGR